MIFFNISIQNPYWRNRFENIKCWTGSTPIKNKFWEIQIMKSAELFQIDFEVTSQRDHAGANFKLGLLGYSLAFTLYDNRHWDPITNNWESRE